MRPRIKLFSALSLALPSAAFSFAWAQGSIPLQVGIAAVTQGKSQNNYIQTLLGNHYSPKQKNNLTGIFGVGYFIDAQNQEPISLSYGVNAYYLAATTVKGTIFQELTYPNLNYEYQAQHLPLYATAKALIKKYNLTIDLGIGPNLMYLNRYNETIIDPQTAPGLPFINHHNVTFSAAAGISLRLNTVSDKMPMECGYRFFYLGQGHFTAPSDQMINTVTNGEAYANAFMCSVKVS